MKLVICTKFHVNRMNCVESRRRDPVDPPPPPILKYSCNYFSFEASRVKCVSLGWRCQVGPAQNSFGLKLQTYEVRYQSLYVVHPCPSLNTKFGVIFGRARCSMSCQSSWFTQLVWSRCAYGRQLLTQASVLFRTGQWQTQTRGPADCPKKSQRACDILIPGWVSLRKIALPGDGQRTMGLWHLRRNARNISTWSRETRKREQCICGHRLSSAMSNLCERVRDAFPHKISSPRSSSLSDVLQQQHLLVHSSWT